MTRGVGSERTSKGARRVSTELSDGTRVTLRPMRASDADGLVRFHATLSTHTTYMRFFSVHPRLSADEVERFTHVDHRDREAVVAVVDRDIVGVGRFDRLPDSTDAEVAFLITDEWQGRGIATALIGWLTDRAREVGVTRFVAETLSGNRPMLSVFRHCGHPITVTADDVVHVTIDLTERA